MSGAKLGIWCHISLCSQVKRKVTAAQNPVRHRNSFLLSNHLKGNASHFSSLVKLPQIINYMKNINGSPDDFPTFSSLLPLTFYIF